MGRKSLCLPCLARMAIVGISTETLRMTTGFRYALAVAKLGWQRQTSFSLARRLLLIPVIVQISTIALPINCPPLTTHARLRSTSSFHRRRVLSMYVLEMLALRRKVE